MRLTTLGSSVTVRARRRNHVLLLTDKAYHSEEKRKGIQYNILKLNSYLKKGKAGRNTKLMQVRWNSSITNYLV